jgi:ribosomal protein S18 acetylase RimI-like enzyme
VRNCSCTTAWSELSEPFSSRRHLSVLAVSPVHQKLRIGSKLLDSGLAIVDSHTPALPAFLEATPAGGKLYRSRGFETKLEVPIKGLDYPFPIMVRPARSG